MKKLSALLMLILLLSLPVISAQAAAPQRAPQAAPGAQPAAPLVAPEDLKPLLEARPSEMRLVAQRYASDRVDLNRFYHALCIIQFSDLGISDSLQPGFTNPVLNFTPDTTRTIVPISYRVCDNQATGFS